MKRILLFTLILFSAGSVARPQESIVRERTGGEIIFAEAHYIASAADSHTVVIPYRIRNDFFVFTRSLSSTTDLFTANADAVVEILDSTGNSIARNIDHIELTSETNVVADLRKDYTQGLMTFRLPHGKYTVLFRVEDKESKRSSPDVNRLVLIPRDADNVHSTFIPVHREHKETSEFSLFNLSGDALFSKNFGFLFVSEKNDLNAVHFSIRRIVEDENDERQVLHDTSVHPTRYEMSTLDFQKQSNGIITRVLPNGKSNVYFFPVNGEQLRQGRYEMNVTIDTLPPLKIIFATRWLDMPLSLTDLDIATYPLQYLLTEEDYSTLRRGSRETRIQKFEEFWRKKDPTPSTAMNEMMTEFFRRVDHAIGAFRTLKEPNGSLTDRGKIYILYGKPTSTERSLYPNSTPKEVWKYENLKKTFVFEDQSKQGNYKLAESK